MNLDAYLQHLGLAQPLPPTIDTLRRVHVAHLAAFPFHNLEIQRRGVIRVDVDSIASKFLAPLGGGYCFEQNTLLGEARALGFDVTTLLGRVGTHALNHMLLRVDVDHEPWLADVGFGGEGILEPVPLRDGVRVTQDGVDFALRREEHHWTLTMHYAGVSEDLFQFSEVPYTAHDIEMVNYFTSMHPESIFRRTLTIQRVTAEERLILRPKVITRYRNGVRTDTPIDPAQIRHFARELFDFDLGDAPLLFEES